MNDSIYQLGATYAGGPGIKPSVDRDGMYHWIKHDIPRLWKEMIADREGRVISLSRERLVYRHVKDCNRLDTLCPACRLADDELKQGPIFRYYVGVDRIYEPRLLTQIKMRHKRNKRIDKKWQSQGRTKLTFVREQIVISLSQLQAKVLKLRTDDEYYN